jgi:hypothetical protein
VTRRVACAPADQTPALDGQAVVTADAEQALAADDQRACRLALGPRLLLGRAVTPAPTGRVTGLATKQSRAVFEFLGTPHDQEARARRDAHQGPEKGAMPPETALFDPVLGIYSGYAYLA